MTTVHRPDVAPFRPTRTVTLAEHATHGVTFTGAMLGRAFVFDPVPAYRVQIYDRTANTVTKVGPTGFTRTGALTFPHTLTLALTADPTCTVVLSTRQTERGVAFGYEVQNTSTRYAVQLVEWPRIELRPWGDDQSDWYFVHTQNGGGYTLNRPQDQAANVLFGTWPPGMPFMGFFESTTKRTLMFWCDDEVGRTKLWRVNPTSTEDGVLTEILHLADRRYDAANAWAVAYEVHLESFDARVRDGRLCGYDMALRYREWATAAARPWTVKGRWWENPNVSDQIRSLDFHVTISGVDDQATGIVDADDCTRQTTDLARLKAAIAPAAPQVTIYGWRPANFNAYWPDPLPFGGTVLAAFDTMHTTLIAAGWNVWLYTMFRFWSTAIPSGRSFRVDNYSTALTSGVPADLRPFLIKNRGAVNKTYEDGSYVGIDFADTVWLDVVSDVIRNCMAGLTTKPQGNYLDGMGPVLPPTIESDLLGVNGDLQDDDGQTDWTWARYWNGYVASLNVAKTRMRAMTAGWAASCEFPQERLIPCVDLTFLQQSATTGAFFAAWTIVYGDYQRVSEFATPQVLFNNESQSLILSQEVALNWLWTGIVSFNHGAHLSPGVLPGSSEYLVAATYNTSQLYYFLEILKLLRAATGACSTYFRGHRGRPVLVTMQGDAAQTSTGLHAWLSAGSSGVQLLFSETWHRYDGNVVVLVANIWPSDASIAAADGSLYTIPTNPALTRTIKLDTFLDDLPAGTKTLYKTVIAGTTVGTATLLGTFTQSLEVEVSFASGTVTMLEVRQA